MSLAKTQIVKCNAYAADFPRYKVNTPRQCYIPWRFPNISLTVRGTPPRHSAC